MTGRKNKTVKCVSCEKDYPVSQGQYGRYGEFLIKGKEVTKDMKIIRGKNPDEKFVLVTGFFCNLCYRDHFKESKPSTPIGTVEKVGIIIGHGEVIGGY